MELLTERYSDKISGMISCFDRVIITGTLPMICFAEGMTSYLYREKIRVFDYKQFAEEKRDKIIKHAEEIAKENNIKIQYINQKGIRKESIIQDILKERGSHPGLVHIFSAKETCSGYSPWHDKGSGKTFLKYKKGQCLHYYFYFIHETLGLMYVRVPTWCPFRLQIYFNGHNYLASQLEEKNIKYSMMDNAFDHIENFEEAQRISDGIDPRMLHEIFNGLAKKYCPVYQDFKQEYHWSIMQIEYATDIVFKEQKDLQNIYDELIATATHTVKPDNIATFLGRKLDGKYKGEMGSNYAATRIEGSRLKHSMGKSSIKMYDKHKKILRIETTSYDITFFKHYRTVEHKDGTSSKKNTSFKKNIYSLSPLQKVLYASNKRYLEFISAIDDKTNGKQKLQKVSSRTIKNNRAFKGLNFFEKNDIKLLEIISKGEFNISGFQSKDIRQHLPKKSKSQISRILKRLRVLGIIKKIGNTYKYYMSNLGKQIALLGMKLKELVIIPHLNVA